MKKFCYAILSVLLALSFVACSGGSAPASPSDNTGTSTASAPSAPDASSSAPAQMAKGIPADELVVPPTVRKEVDLAPEAMLQALKDAWVEFSGGELAENAEYLEIVGTEADEYSEKTVIETGAAVQIVIDVRLKKVYENGEATGEVKQELDFIKVVAMSEILTIWPRVNLYAPLRAFVCETAAEAEMLTALMWENENTPEEEEALYPVCFGGYRLELPVKTGDPSAYLRPFSIGSTDHFDTVVDGRRLALPAPQNLDLNEYGYENVLVNRAELIGSTFTVEMTVDAAYEDSVYGDLPDDPNWTRWHVLGVLFYDESTLAGLELEEGDRVKVVATLASANVNANDGDYYSYSVTLHGQTIEKLP